MTGLPAAGAVFTGKYRIERALGAGGMATVYVAEDLRHRRRVAVKVLRPELAATLGADRFLREIEIAGGLHHPHILPLYDSGAADGVLYYVMPLAEGESLRDRLTRTGAMPVDAAVTIIREVADALAYSHQHGVVHRDIKPENILLTSGHATVTDFGIAKAVSDSASTSALTGVGITLGTPAYMAPEQALADPDVDHRADLYALGVVAYELLTGTHPFGQRPAQSMVAAHLTETPVPIAALRSATPPALATLVTSLLAKKASDRPQSATEVLRILDGATPPQRASGRARTLVGAALLGAAVVAYASWPRPSADGGSLGSAIQTIAVLPFENTSGVVEDDYFSDGMTDELAQALSRIPGLRLAGRTSSYSFKGKSVPAQVIGRALDVRVIVNGTVRRSGERLRVSAQLVSAVDGKVLWDSVFESRSRDVFGVQDEFTRAIVAAIAPTLGSRHADEGRAVRGTRDPDAYELYLKGRYYWLERGGANVARSIGYFKQAIARDSLFARAYAGLAQAYDILNVYFADPSDSTTALLEVNARRAFALDSNLADARVALGSAAERGFQLREAELRYRSALVIEPGNATVHHYLGALLLQAGRTDEGIESLRRSTQLDPMAKSAGSMYGLALVYAGRFEEGRSQARRVLSIDSVFMLGRLVLGHAQTFGGQPDSAIRTFERVIGLYPTAPALHIGLLFAYAAAGRWEDANRLRAELQRRGTTLTVGVESALAEAVFGDREPAIRLLATEQGRRAWHLYIGFGCSPLNTVLWSDTRFRATVKRLGIEPCTAVHPLPFVPR